MAILVSVVIPTRGRLETLRETVRRVLAEPSGIDPSPPADAGAPADVAAPADAADAADTGHAIEVVVSDDGSPDATCAWVAGEAQCDPRLRLVAGPRRGRAAARNAGLREARGEVVCFLDDDLWVEPGFLAAHLRAHGRNAGPAPASNPDAPGEPAARLAVMGRMLPWPGNQPTVANRAFDRHLTRVMGEIERQPGPLSCTHLCSGNVSFRRAELAAGPLFDEGFQEYSFEDSELGYRLDSQGYELRYAAAALAYHHTATSVADNLRKCEEAGRSAVRFLTRHPRAADRLRPLCELPGVPASRAARRLRARVGHGIFFSAASGALLGGALRLLLAAGPPRAALGALQLACLHRFGRSFRTAGQQLAAAEGGRAAAAAVNAPTATPSITP